MARTDEDEQIRTELALGQARLVRNDSAALRAWSQHSRLYAEQERGYSRYVLDKAARLVARAKALPAGELPRLKRRPRAHQDPGFEQRLEKVKAARTRVAAELGLEAGVLCGRTTLEAVVRARPADRVALEAIPELRRWQIDVLGDALLEALR